MSCTETKIPVFTVCARHRIYEGEATVTMGSINLLKGEYYCNNIPQI